MSYIIDNELRDQVWRDYYYRRQNRICSRCGDYNRYEIQESRQPTERDLSEKYGCDFYTMNYKIKTTRILTNNSLTESDWGCLCQHCKDHTLGKSFYDLFNSKEDAEYEIQDMRQNERKRQLKQDDEIKKLRKEFNKERRENGGRPAREISHPTAISEIKNNNNLRPEIESEKL